MQRRTSANLPSRWLTVGLDKAEGYLAAGARSSPIRPVITTVTGSKQLTVAVVCPPRDDKSLRRPDSAREFGLPVLQPLYFTSEATLEKGRRNAVVVVVSNIPPQHGNLRTATCNL